MISPGKENAHRHVLMQHQTKNGPVPFFSPLTRMVRSMVMTTRSRPKQTRAKERRCFCIFWEWLTKNNLTLEQLDKMQNDSDPPDFIFQYDGKSIALEHTEVSRQKLDVENRLSPQHSLVIQRKICEHLTELLRASSEEIPPLYVSVSFGPCKNVKMADEVTVAKALYDFIRNRLARDEPLPLTVYRHELDEITAFKQCLNNILIVAGGSGRSAGISSSGAVDEWGLSIFEEAAAKKAKALPRYEAEYSACWLLLSAGGPHRAQWIEPSEAAAAHGITSEFDRVFYVDEGRRRVYEISTNR